MSKPTCIHTTNGNEEIQRKKRNATCSQKPSIETGMTQPTDIKKNDGETLTIPANIQPRLHKSKE